MHSINYTSKDLKERGSRIPLRVRYEKRKASRIDESEEEWSDENCEFSGNDENDEELYNEAAGVANNTTRGSITHGRDY